MIHLHYPRPPYRIYASRDDVGRAVSLVSKGMGVGADEAIVEDALARAPAGVMVVVESIRGYLRPVATYYVSTDAPDRLCRLGAWVGRCRGDHLRLRGFAPWHLCHARCAQCAGQPEADGQERRTRGG